MKIEVEHERYISIKTETASFLIDAIDYEETLVLNVSGRGKNALRMKIQSILENEINIELIK